MSLENTSSFDLPATRPTLLSETQINLRGLADVDHRELVPPNTPKGLNLDYLITNLPRTFPRLTNLSLPIVRKVGVKGAMEAMSVPFKCEDFKVNFVQFWFLDIFTDCLWRLQDEYHFPMEYQNAVMEWILYFFNLMRAPDLNLSRGKVFRVFREAIRLCENRVEHGVEIIPCPEDVFVLNQKNLESTLTFESDESGSASSIFEETDEEEGEYLVLRREGTDEVYKLPEKICAWYTQDEDCSSSSEETSTEPTIEEKPSSSESLPKSTTSAASTTTVESVENEQIEYYKPDMSTPPRFKSYRSLFGSESEVSVMSYLENQNVMEEAYSDHSNEPEVFKWTSIPRKLPHGPCPSRVFDPSEEDRKKERVEEEIKKSWQEYNLWHMKKDHTNNSRNEEDSENEREELTKKLKKFLKRRRKEDSKDENKFINTCALLAIKEFIYDYFYDSFQFTLVSIAMKHPHRLLVQELNATWNTPKTFKGELKRPAVKIPKPPKKEKQKKKDDEGSKKKEQTKHDDVSKSKGKKKKGDKSSKSKEKEKKEDKSSKSKEKKKKDDESSKKSDDKKKKTKKKKDDKSSKKSKDDETPKKSRKDKKDKSKTLKKHEETLSKASLKKQQQEERLKMEEMKRLEENKKYVFPLKDAVNDNFFREIFEEWQRKPGKSKKEGKDLKDKGSKKSEKDEGSKKDSDSKKSEKDKGSKKGKKDRDSKKSEKDSKVKAKKKKR